MRCRRAQRVSRSTSRSASPIRWMRSCWGRSSTRGCPTVSGSNSLSRRRAERCRICWRRAAGASSCQGLLPATIEAAVADMLARAPVTVPRMTKSGSRDIAVTDNWVTHQAQEGELVVTVRAATPTVRPDDIVRALGLGAPPACAPGNGRARCRATRWAIRCPIRPAQAESEVPHAPCGLCHTASRSTAHPRGTAPRGSVGE